MNKEDLKPTRTFKHFTDITPEILHEEKVLGILADLDDTLAARNCRIPDDEVITWIRIMKENGFPFCIVSNNHKKRTTLYSQKLNVGFFYNSLKPMKFTVFKALSVLNLKPEQTVFIGDQLFTDVKAAQACQMKSFLVTPISNKSGLFVGFKRFLENKIYKRKT